MKLLILHLSDMHFIKKKAYQEININAIVAALQHSIYDVKSILLLISGDLSDSGKKGECIQVSRFIHQLKGAIAQRYSISEIRVCVVPGNHDIDYNKGNGDLKTDGLTKINEEGSYSNHIKSELIKQEEFLILAKRYNCFDNTELFCKVSFVFEGKTVQVNLLNTAVFSSLENDLGYHYISDDDVKKLDEQNDSDYIFTVMHHPYYWFEWNSKHHLLDKLIKSTDIVFFGHDHFSDSYQIEQDGKSALLQAGGELCKEGNWQNSEFYVGSLDLETREYKAIKCQWSDREQIYRTISLDPKFLSRNRKNNLGFALKDEFVEDIITDNRFLIGSDI